MQRMKRKTLMLALMLSLGLAAHAQWRVGATVGADHNHYSIDSQLDRALQYIRTGN